MKTKKKVRLSDFLTVEELVEAIKMYRETGEGTFANKCAEEIITPILSRINAKLGQENHPLFLAYMVEYALIESGVKETMQKMERKQHERNGSSN